jgi:tetratricopeptide (TPR) repeat protein
MTTTSEVAAPSERSSALGSLASQPRRRGRSIVGTLTGASLAAGLAAFNGWWYWRDHRPLPDVVAINNLLRREKYDEASRALAERVRRSPHDGESWITLARALAGKGDLSACARALHQVPSWWPQKPEALLREGQALMQLERAGDAERAWFEVIRDDPLHPVASELYHDAAQELLKLYAIEDRWEDAYPVMWLAYDHALPIDHPVLLMMRMRPELERVAPKETIALLKKYVAADASDWEARRALARAVLALGQRDDAERDFQACLKSRPDDLRAWRDYLTMLLDEGNLDKFRTLLSQPPPAADTEPETWLFRGIVREKAGDFAGAADNFQKAVDLNPYAPKYYYRLATAEERLGRREKAAVHRRKTKEMNDARAQLPGAYTDFFAARGGDSGAPAMAAAYRHLGSICETLGWTRAAQGWNRLADTDAGKDEGPRP